MATPQQILQRVTDMQRAGQENLPVLPNNGNPGTIYNTSPIRPQPQQTAPVQAQLTPAQLWAQRTASGPSVARIREMAERIRAGLPNTGQPATMQSASTMQQQQPVAMPVLPARMV